MARKSTPSFVLKLPLTATAVELVLAIRPDGFQPASGRGFALSRVTPGVGAGRSRNPGQRGREAAEVYPQALVSAARASESGARLEPQMAHDPEALGFQPGEASHTPAEIQVTGGSMGMADGLS